MPEMIQINFNRYFPVYPLAGVCILPHASIPLHVFEPRYTHMVNDALDATGQIAMATFAGDQWKFDYDEAPPIRPIVCLGQIERHEKLPMERYNVFLQGVCRARIIEEKPPEIDRPYRLVKLQPLEANPDSREPELVGWRARVRELLERDSMSRLRFQSKVIEWFDRDDIPSHVLIEIIGHLLITTMDDSERRYNLLSQSDPLERADFAENELRMLSHLIETADIQTSDWPKGVSFN